MRDQNPASLCACSPTSRQRTAGEKAAYLRVRHLDAHVLVLGAAVWG
jgi:hypothetical protein